MRLGRCASEEVFQFEQEDLIEDDVMLLDTYHSIYVWVGDLANAEEKKSGPEVAAQYVA